MPNFYSPNQFDPEPPISCFIIPTKLIVCLVQILSVIAFLVLAFVSEKSLIVPYSLLTIVCLLFFFGFAMNIILLMTTYLGLLALFFISFSSLIIARLCGLDWLLTSFQEMEKYLPSTIHIIIYAALFIAVFLYYMYLTWTVIKYANIKKNLLNTDPEFDTTQGLYHYNDTAYDGAGDVYPTI